MNKTPLKKAIVKMLERGEFEKVIRTARGNDRKACKALYESVKGMSEEQIYKMPEIALIYACRSWSFWQDAYVFMRMEEEKDEKQSPEKAEEA